MAKTTAKKKNYNKKYYQKHKEKIIDEVQEKQKSNKKEYNKDKREYYHENQTYRKYKIQYARDYRKREKVKSKARKDRKAYR